MRRPPLAERIEVAPSPVHGHGVFARVRIRKGAWIGTFEGTPTRTDGTHVLWVIEDDGSERGICGRNELRFLNHAPSPNAEFAGAELYALRDIPVGRELTIDYGEAWEGEAWEGDA